MLKSVPMKRFFLATPRRYEDQVIENLGALGSVQLITDYTIKGFKKVDNVERCEKYVKLQQRIASVLSALPREKVAKKSLPLTLKESFSKMICKEASLEASLEEIESYVSKIESTLDEELGRLEKLRSELNRLKVLEESLAILQKYGLRVDAFGDFEYSFVKAGFMNKALSPKLQRYAEGTSVKYTRQPVKREEDFIVIMGLNQDRPRMEEALTLLNFAELAFPKDIDSDPEKALKQTKTSAAEMEERILEIENSLRAIGKEFQERSVNYEPVVRRALTVEEARSTFSRTETVSLVHGWIPAARQESLEKVVQASTHGAAFLKFEDPCPDEKPPVRLRNPMIMRSFEVLTRLRGIPDYSELDPTPIVTVLFTVMFGMMFGDVGQGIVVLIMGVIFTRLQRGFLNIPAGGVRRLGGILVMCGISATFFGFLYGEIFLSEALHPIFGSPIHTMTTIIIVSLLFGVAQLTLGIIIKIVNLIRIKATVEAAFGGVRLAYYITGVALAVKFTGNMSFTVFSENLWLTIIAVALLCLLFLSPTLEGILKHEFKFGEGIMMGAAEFIETFLSYLTNSVSYVRLAAFAIAHSALGLSAVILTESIGGLTSFVAMNLLAMTIEFLGVLIQCMRLTYYEFFTKFYSGKGNAFLPFSLPKIHVRIK